ncbi:MAG: ABC transporter permease [Deltaproteobacteria bacterium]|nr:ABC transporter permease [Deltaproteobacteria bacterium]
METLDFNKIARKAIQDHRNERVYLFRLFLKKKLAVFSAFVLVSIMLAAVFAPWVAPYPDQGKGSVNLEDRLQPFSRKHLLGTDTYGRDLLSRAIYGGRISVFGGFFIVLMAALIGVPLGLWAGYREGVSGAVIMRTAELVLSFPSVLVAMGVSIVVGAGSITALVALIIPWWPWYTRLVQGEVLSIKNMLYVEAAQMLGYGRIYILFRHLLPNILTPVIVMMMLDIGPAIIAIGVLSFLGLGTQAPSADWGLMVWEGAPNILGEWWIAIVPGFAMFLLVTAFNIFGDTLKDILDPN